MEDSCFTTLCWFLPYININQSQVYICPLPPEMPPPHHPSSIPSHPSRLSQSTGLSYLCYIANSHLLSILHMAMYVFILFISFVPPSFPSGVHKSILYVCVSIAALQRRFTSIIFLDSIYMCKYKIFAFLFLTYYTL